MKDEGLRGRATATFSITYSCFGIIDITCIHVKERYVDQLARSALDGSATRPPIAGCGR